MAFLREFGMYLPSRVVTNAEMALMVGCEPQWITNVSGIDERRFAACDETVVDLAVAAGRDCLCRAGVHVSQIDMVIVSCGAGERQFPGPAAAVAKALGLENTPAWDLPMASAGSVFGLAIATRLASTCRNILLIAAEKMSNVILRQPMERGVSILFGDGAGACMVSATEGKAEIAESVLHSDGAYADDLKLEFDAPLAMSGRTVILQASRKIPSAIQEVLALRHCTAGDVDVFLMHQANQNLIARIAQALTVAEEKFYSNIRRYGNTSSASMLIAAAEWSRQAGFKSGVPVCFAGFGAGFHWGSVLAMGV